MPRLRWLFPGQLFDPAGLRPAAAVGGRRSYCPPWRRWQQPRFVGGMRHHVHVADEVLSSERGREEPQGGTSGTAQPFTHLGVPHAEQYRRLLRVFARARERFIVHLRPEDVAAELRAEAPAGRGADHPADPACHAGGRARGGDRPAAPGRPLRPAGPAHAGRRRPRWPSRSAAVEGDRLRAGPVR
jgi:hypothetical protein